MNSAAYPTILSTSAPKWGSTNPLTNMHAQTTSRYGDQTDLMFHRRVRLFEFRHTLPIAEVGEALRRDLKMTFE
jgi:hypothetical protein